MRAMFLVVASVLLCVGLFGCDRQPQAPVAAPVVAVAPPCNCAPPPPAPVAQAVHRSRHHHQAWSEHESSSYGESSESYSASNESHEYSGSSSVTAAQPDTSSTQAAWIDGYGRSHYATGEQADENPALLSREDRHTRHEVWRGYDSKCAARDE